MFLVTDTPDIQQLDKICKYAHMFLGLEGILLSVIYDYIIAEMSPFELSMVQ